MGYTRYNWYFTEMAKIIWLFQIVFIIFESTSLSIYEMGQLFQTNSQIDGLVQERRNSITNALELCLFALNRWDTK